MKRKRLMLIAVTVILIVTCVSCIEVKNELPDIVSDPLPEKKAMISESAIEDVIEEVDLPAKEEDSNIDAGNNTPLSIHGKLSVKGTDIVDKNGDKYQLYGMSTHGIAWFPDYINYESLQTLRYDWNTNCFRIAMYTYEFGGYCNGGDREALKTLVKNGVEYATKLGMYVIIDWHVLNEEDPNIYIDDSIEFFNEMSGLYAGYDNVLYEICNEPNRLASWKMVKNYAEKVIPVIRKNDSDAIIIVGTPTWSQDVDKALESPLEYDNIMYALHFYAATHKEWLRERAQTCLEKGLPIIISEFSICDASGNGELDIEQGNQWMSFIDENNLSYICWNLSNKNESSAVIKSSCSKLNGWTVEDLSETGQWIYNCFQNETN